MLLRAVARRAAPPLCSAAPCRIYPGTVAHPVPWRHIYRRPFHGTPRRRNPLVALGVRFGARMAARLAGRQAKRRWDKMTPEERFLLKQKLRGGGGGGLNNFHLGAVSVVASGAAWYACHLEDSPVTLRRRYISVGIEDMCRAGRKQADALVAELAREDRLVALDDPVFLQVEKITDRLVDGLVFHPDIIDEVDRLEAFGRDTFEWKLHIIHGGPDLKGRPSLSDEVNAFVLPDGSIFVYTGILDACGNEDALAVVLAHEMAHAICHHSAETVSNGGPVLVATSILTAILWSLGLDFYTTLFMENITDWIVKMIAELPYSRELEYEADAVGLQISSAACFDPYAAPEFWERMAKMAGEAPVHSHSMADLTKTHPTSTKRFHALTEQLQFARQIGRDCGCPDFDLGDRYNPRKRAPLIKLTSKAPAVDQGHIPFAKLRQQDCNRKYPYDDHVMRVNLAQPGSLGLRLGVQRLYKSSEGMDPPTRTRLVVEKIQKGGLADRWKGGRFSEYAASHEKKHLPVFLLDVDGRQLPPDVVSGEVVDYIRSKSPNRNKHSPTQLTFTTDERNFVRVSQD
jgi:metalloendopeptidase OMA1, mitochondrial